MSAEEIGAGADEAVFENSNTLLATTFQLGGALCALDAAIVEEVVRLRQTTRVPHAPNYLFGVMNLRGNIVSVIDLGRKLGLGEVSRTEASRVYIVRARSELIGLLVDSAEDVVEFDSAAIQPPPANVPGIERKYIRGVGRSAGRLAALLDSETVLAAESD